MPGADFHFTRLRKPGKPLKKDEDWLLTTGLTTTAVEHALFGHPRAQHIAVNTTMSGEIDGYAWLPVDKVAALVHVQYPPVKLVHKKNWFHFFNWRVPRKVGHIAKLLP